MVVLDRILRDEVLNAVTAIRARAEPLRETGPDDASLDSIDRATDRIHAAVEDVGFPVRTHDDPGGQEPTALRDATAAALLAGVAMGTSLQAFANTIPVIGSLYGVASVPVGWITHLFHSVVFGVFFAATLRRRLRPAAADLSRRHCGARRPGERPGSVLGSVYWLLSRR